MTRRYMRKKCKETDTSKSKKKFKCDMTFVCFFTLFICDMTRPYEWNKGGLRLVGSLKLQVCFAEYRLFYKALLQKRPMIFRSLLIVATAYTCADIMTRQVPLVLKTQVEGPAALNK